MNAKRTQSQHLRRSRFRRIRSQPLSGTSPDQAKQSFAPPPERRDRRDSREKTPLNRPRRNTPIHRRARRRVRRLPIGVGDAVTPVRWRQDRPDDGDLALEHGDAGARLGLIGGLTRQDLYSDRMTADRDLCYLPAREQLAGFASGALSPIEALEAQIERAGEVTFP